MAQNSSNSSSLVHPIISSEDPSVFDPRSALLRQGLKSGDWVHITAIGGTGMGSLAALLQDLGLKVTGSDGPLYPPMSTFLKERKFLLREGYQPKNLNGAEWGFQEAHPKLVVIGNAIGRNNAEAMQVEELKSAGKLKVMSFPEALAEFAIDQRKSFVVCGTHGKTTTTSLFAWALEGLGKKPGFLIGGIPKNFTSGCRVGQGMAFVSEGDEYDTAYWDKESKFLHYRPHWVLCTGIEFDHADIYTDLASIVSSFKKLVSKTKSGWLLIDKESAPKSEPVEEVFREIGTTTLKCFRYGFSKTSEYRLISIQTEELPWRSGVLGVRLNLKVPELGEVSFVSPMSGRHNALNALGVFATLHSSGELKNVEQFQKILQSFEGIKRRQEEIFVGPTTCVIDDFAHHPTAIAETIAGIHARYPDRKLAAFFEARSATSSRNIFLKEFSESFDEADAIFLSPPSKTNIPENEKLNVHELVKLIQERSKNSKQIFLESDITELSKCFVNWRNQLKENSSNEKIIALVMSNGPFGGIHALLKDV